MPPLRFLGHLALYLTTATAMACSAASGEIEGSPSSEEAVVVKNPAFVESNLLLGLTWEGLDTFRLKTGTLGGKAVRCYYGMNGAEPAWVVLTPRWISSDTLRDHYRHIAPDTGFEKRATSTKEVKLTIDEQNDLARLLYDVTQPKKVPMLTNVCPSSPF